MILLANLFHEPLDDLLNEDVRVIEAVDFDLSKKGKFKTATIYLTSLLVLAVRLITFSLIPKEPTIELIQETIPKDAEVVPFKKKKFKEVIVQ